MDQYTVRLVRHSDADPFLLEGFVEAAGSGFRKEFSTLDQLHAILSTLESGRAGFRVIWVREQARSWTPDSMEQAG